MPKSPAERIVELSIFDVRGHRQKPSLRQTTAVIERADAERLEEVVFWNRRFVAVELRERRGRYFVSEYHFVCRNKDGVTENYDGTFWSGSWIVDQKIVRKSLGCGAHVALHRTKAERSYLQGTIIGWRLCRRDRRQNEQPAAGPKYGVEFLVERTNKSFYWVGDGTAEKGYLWQPDHLKHLQT